MRGYIFLAISILFEVFGTTMLKVSEGFQKIAPSIAVVLGFVAAFYFLSLCLKTIPLSLAYAIWSGVGTALTAIIGIIIWNDPFNILTFSGLVLIIGGVVILNTSKKVKTVEKTPLAS